jgi:hypothetical protein
MATRQEVYAAVDGERAYQDARWVDDQAPAGVHQHTPTEWLVYMQDYLTEAMGFATRCADPASAQLILHNIRKITAMGVACMEQNGAPTR